MLGRYRRSYRALGRCLIVCAALLGGAYAVDDNASAQAGPQVAKPAPAQDLAPALTAIQKGVEGIASEIKAASANPNAEEEEERAEADLRAQQDMAHWAYAMFVATAITTALTSIGVVLLGFTLKYTKDTLGEAKAATAAAKDAVTVTREIGEAQARAYVFVHEPKRTKREDSGDPNPWDIEMDIRNFGQTPAYGVQADFDFAIVDTAGAFSFAFPNPRIIGKRNDIGPGHFFKIRVPLPDLRNEVWALFKLRKKTLLVWGRVTFTDAFGHERWTTFRMFQDGNNIRNFLFWHEGNETSETPKRETE